MPTSTNAIEPGEPPRNSIGGLLRETRRSLGGDLDKIAETLRIRASFLKAIEESHYDRLPAQVYAIGFVRAYALHLGLDGDEAVRRFKQETADFEPLRGLSFPVPLVERSIPGGRMLLAALIFALCGYGLWYYVSTGERARPERVSAVPADLEGQAANQGAAAPQASAASPPGTETKPAAAAATPTLAAPSGGVAAGTAAPTPPAPVVTSAAPVAPAPAGTTPAATASATNSAASSAASRPATATGSPAPAGASPPAPTVVTGASEGRVYGSVGVASRIVIEVTKDSWVQINDGDRVLLDKVLHPGDSYRVGNRSGLVMRTGNAAGLAIEVDGRPTPPLKGTVRNQIALDPDRLVAGTAGAN